MTLYIDTTDFNSVTFYLRRRASPVASNRASLRSLNTGSILWSSAAGNLYLADKKLLMKSYKIDPHKSNEILTCLESFLLHHKIKLDDGTHLQVKKIVVNTGPGSFTGTRVGAAHALALSLAWNVPLKTLDKDRFEKELKNASK